jgi:hypothetical protein
VCDPLNWFVLTRCRLCHYDVCVGWSNRAKLWLLVSDSELFWILQRWSLNICFASSYLLSRTLQVRFFSGTYKILSTYNQNTNNIPGVSLVVCRYPKKGNQQICFRFSDQDEFVRYVLIRWLIVSKLCWFKYSMINDTIDKMGKVIMEQFEQLLPFAFLVFRNIGWTNQPPWLLWNPSNIGRCRTCNIDV